MIAEYGLQSVNRLGVLRGLSAAELKKNKLQLLLGSVALGSAVIFVMGRPTLLTLFSDKLEARLWQPEDIVKQNLLAMAVSLGALMILPKYWPTP